MLSEEGLKVDNSRDKASRHPIPNYRQRARAIAAETAASDVASIETAEGERRLFGENAYERLGVGGLSRFENAACSFTPGFWCR